MSKLKYKCYYDTDIGVGKRMNQDSLLFIQAETIKDNVCLAAVCDGMGGLEKGELASATVIRKLKNWFLNDCKELVKSDDYHITDIAKSLNRLMNQVNDEIRKYGMQHQIRLGTTATIIYFYQNEYCMVHIGDSRLYYYQNQEITLLSEDHSVVNRMFKQGEISQNEMEFHKKRNVLTQCIGASEMIKPQTIIGTVLKEDSFLLCSDGFYHKLKESDFLELMNKNEEMICKEMRNKIQYVMMKGEKDNITCCIVKVIG